MARRIRKAEPSRWHAETRGRFPTFSGHKARALAAAGMGEPLAVQRAVAQLSRTREETAPLPRKATTPAEVVLGLGLDNADQQQITRLITDTPVEFTQQTQTQRIALARGRLVETLRSMKRVPSDVRMEITKRAIAYWRHAFQTDYGKAPTIRYTVRKAMQPDRTGMVFIPMPQVFVPAPTGPLRKADKKPPGSGWQNIPRGTRGGFRRRRGGKWEYWYPDQGEVAGHLVTGETYPVKDQLAALDGAWDPDRKGWWVPLHHAEEAQALVRGAGKERTERRQHAQAAAQERRKEMALVQHARTYDFRDKIKRLGGEWDGDRKGWWVPKDNAQEVWELLGVEREKAQANATIPAGRTRSFGSDTKIDRTGQTVLTKDGPMTVVGSRARYYAEDGLSFGLDQDEGWLITETLRQPTEEEAAPILDRERRESRFRAAKKAIADLIYRPADQGGERPEHIEELPAGRTVDLQTPGTYGRGDGVLIPDDPALPLHLMIYNGRDGDNWGYNNYSAYIVWRVPRSADRVAALAEYEAAKAESLRKAGGPYIGPRGGKWADPKHTIPWKPDKPHPQLDLFNAPQRPAPQHADAKPRIVEIISVVDTREREVQEDERGRERFVPIPGSGDIRPCDRCDREHEIHVKVRLSDGSQRVMGISCAKGDDPETCARLKTLASAAKTIGKLTSMLARRQTELDAVEAKNAEAKLKLQAIPRPPVEENITLTPEQEALRPKWAEGMQAWRIGTLREWFRPESPPEGVPYHLSHYIQQGLKLQRQRLVEAWEGHQLKRLGADLPREGRLQGEVDDLTRRLKRAVAKRDKLLAEARTQPAPEQSAATMAKSGGHKYVSKRLVGGKWVYTYGVPFRPISSATVPQGYAHAGEADKSSPYKRHGTVSYEQPLTKEQVRSYQLVHLPESHDGVVEHVADQMREYAEAFIEDYDDDPSYVEMTVGAHLDDLEIPTDADRKKVTAAVVEKFRAEQTKKSLSRPMPHTIDAFTLFAKASKGEQAASHKYEARKPDGHGGWLYKYPGEPGWQSGRGKHQGSTNALPGEHFDPHHEGFQPSIEKRPDGGFNLHTAEGVHSEFRPGMTLDDHKASHAFHQAAHDKAKAKGNDALAAAHAHALKAHAMAHNMKQEQAQQRTGAQPSPDQLHQESYRKPGEAPTMDFPEVTDASGQPANWYGQDQQPPSQRQQKPAQAPQAKGAPSPAPQAEQGVQAPPEQPQGPADQGPLPQAHPAITQIQQHLADVTQVMGAMVGAHQEQADLKQRIRAVKTDRSLPRSMRKRLIAQHEAAIAVSKARQAELGEQHDKLMAAVKAASKQLKKPHPILGALLRVFEKFSGGRKDKEEQRAIESGTAPHDAHAHRTSAADAVSMAQQAQQQPAFARSLLHAYQTAHETLQKAYPAAPRLVSRHYRNVDRRFAFVVPTEAT